MVSTCATLGQIDIAMARKLFPAMLQQSYRYIWFPAEQSDNLEHWPPPPLVRLTHTQSFLTDEF